jgi:hypothetical protein
VLADAGLSSAAAWTTPGALAVPSNTQAKATAAASRETEMRDMKSSCFYSV